MPVLVMTATLIGLTLPLVTIVLLRFRLSPGVRPLSLEVPASGGA